MRFHDYHLNKYEVSDNGETIALYLIYDYPNTEKDRSCIIFSGVAIYHFIHTGGAIITDIDELPISDLIIEIGNQLNEWHHWHGVRFWKDSIENYSLYLQSEGYKAWKIESAIGFYGFVVAKNVRNP